MLNFNFIIRLLFVYFLTLSSISKQKTNINTQKKHQQHKQQILHNNNDNKYNKSLHI